MPRASIRTVALVLALACRAAAAQSPVAPTVPPVAFEGFGLGDFSAAVGAAPALHTAMETEQDSVPLDVVVRGPGGGRGATDPLAAEVRSRIEGIDVAAGLEGDAAALAERTPRWIGRIGMGNERASGLEALELRARLESRAGAHRLGVEIGPRIERRLPRGAKVFLEGAAKAEAVRAADAGGWQLPGTSTADSMTAVGVSARTGIIR